MNFFILYLFHTIDIMRFTILQRWILECRENEGFSVSNTARQEKNLGQDSTPPDAEFCNQLNVDHKTFLVFLMFFSCICICFMYCSIKKDSSTDVVCKDHEKKKKTSVYYITINLAKISFLLFSVFSLNQNAPCSLVKYDRIQLIYISVV